MNKKSPSILLVLLIIAVFGVLVYQNNQKNIVTNNNFPAIPIWDFVNKDGWAITTDCKNIKLYFWDGKNPSESGLEDEQDIAIDYEKKILSIGLNEGLYGHKKRLEINYAQPSDYKNCSPDVKRLIKATVSP